jgi:hypothetical protein
MKYRLRSMMILVTLICVVLGTVAARVEYLRRKAMYHERWASHYEDKMRGDSFSLIAVNENWHHDQLAKAYRKAMYRPWTTVDETPDQQVP